MSDLIEGLEGEWLNLETLMDFIKENLMTVNPKFVVDNFDFKYIDIRIDMRTGYAILSRGSKKAALVDKLKATEKGLYESRKKRTKGEINEAYAKTIEANKGEISKLKAKVNKLTQKVEKLSNYQSGVGDE